MCPIRILRIDAENGTDEEKKTGTKGVKQVIIFKKKFKGEDKFIETAKLLAKMSPMEPL